MSPSIYSGAVCPLAGPVPRPARSQHQVRHGVRHAGVLLHLCRGRQGLHQVIPQSVRDEDGELPAECK